mmetsp:Transcript_25091/g.48849  ORF Transcript_25091/g.48849 Transcript_25091/m.48849 type:complete len:373 (-) Transcript_25091:1489-2607(-)
MFYLTKIKTFKINKASIWSLKWSSFGNFLISCGVDGCVIVFSLTSSQVFYNFNRRNFIEKKIFQNWNCITFTKKEEIKSTHRDVNFSKNNYQIGISTFIGNTLVCKIFFSKKLRAIFFEKLTILKGSSSEVKNCAFSPDGTNFITCSRNKMVWNWEKNSENFFNSFFVLENHESDIKQSIWHPQLGIILTSTYEGFVRFFQKNFKEIWIINSFKFSFFSIFALKTDESGKKIIFSSTKGELFICPFWKNISKKTKKLSKLKYKFFFFSLGRQPIQSIDVSKTHSFLSLSGEEDSLTVLKICNVWAFKTIFKILYKGIKTFDILTFENSVIRSHCGNLNDLVWHPKNENLVASCGEDSLVIIWNFSDLKNNLV